MRITVVKTGIDFFFLLSFRVSLPLKFDHFKLNHVDEHVLLKLSLSK